MTLTRLLASLATAGAFALLTACSSGNNTPDAIPGNHPPSAAAAASPAAPADPDTAAGAQTAAEQVASLFSAGDWGSTWDMFAAEAQRAITRSDYIKLKTTCPGPVGTPLTVKSVRFVGPKLATFVGTRLGVDLVYELRYEAGQWRLTFSSTDLQDYRKGVATVIAERKKQGAC